MTDARKTSKVSSKAENASKEEVPILQPKAIDLRGVSPKECRTYNLYSVAPPREGQWLAILLPKRAALPGDLLLTERFDGSAFLEYFDDAETDILERTVGVVLYTLQFINGERVSRDS